MQDAAETFNAELSGLAKGEWLTKLAGIAEEQGYFEPLGKRHFAAFVEKGTTLLVTFETIQGMRALSESAVPLGWNMVRDHGWSHLCVASDGDTWFRDETLYAYFDRLVDDGFFDEFETVLFYGAWPLRLCGGGLFGRLARRACAGDPAAGDAGRAGHGMGRPLCRYAPRRLRLALWLCARHAGRRRACLCDL